MSTSDSTNIDAAGPITVAVADNRRLRREGICAILADHQDFEVVEMLDDAFDLEAVDVIVHGELTQPLTTRRPLVRLADVGDVRELAHSIRTCRQSPPVVVERNASGAARRLTAREQTVLNAVGSGASAAEIGAALGISARTVERHKQSVIAKLGVPNHARAVLESLQK